MENKKIINLKINGIHCDGCVSKIKKGLDSLNMDHMTDINIESGRIKIILNSGTVGLGEIKSKISELGFQVESVELE
jgi:Cu2+-exporting ATPase